MPTSRARGDEALELRAKAARLYHQGLTPKMIGARLGRRVTTIRVWLREDGVRLPDDPHRREYMGDV